MSSPAEGERSERLGYAWPAVGNGDDGTARSETSDNVRLTRRWNRLGPTEESAVTGVRAAGWTCEAEFRIVLSDLYVAHRHSLGRLAALWVDGNGEDAVQDAFLRVWLHWDRIHDQDKVLTYVQRAVVNVAKSELR